MLCSMMLGMTARWMLGRMLPKWPAVLSCVRFRPRLACHLAVGDSRRGLFAALEMLAQRKSVTEVAMAVGYDSVSAFIEMFRTMLGTTPQTYFRGGVRGQAVHPRAQELARSQCSRK